VKKNERGVKYKNEGNGKIKMERAFFYNGNNQTGIALQKI